MRNNELRELRKRATLLIFRKCIRTHRSAQSTLSSTDVDLVNVSTSLHAKSPVLLANDVNLADFSTDLHVTSTISSLAAICGKRQIRKQSVCPRHLMINNVPIKQLWICTSAKFNTPHQDQTDFTPPSGRNHLEFCV